MLCTCHRHLADFVQEKRPAVALLETPDALGHRTGERAFLVPEKLAFQQGLGDRRAVDRHEKLVAAPAVMVDRAGHQFLAGTALAGDHHRGLAVRDAAHHLEHLLHRLGLADDAVLVLVDGELRLEGSRRAHLALRLQRRIDDDLQVEGQRFLADEVVRSQLHRLDDGLRRAERAGEHHHGVRVFLPDPGEQFQPTVGLHVRVGDQEVRASRRSTACTPSSTRVAVSTRVVGVSNWWTAHSRKSISGSTMTIVCIRPQEQVARNLSYREPNLR